MEILANCLAQRPSPHSRLASTKALFEPHVPRGPPTDTLASPRLLESEAWLVGLVGLPSFIPAQQEGSERELPPPLAHHISPEEHRTPPATAARTPRFRQIDKTFDSLLIVDEICVRGIGIRRL